MSSVLSYSTQKTQNLDRSGALKKFLNIHSVAKHEMNLRGTLWRKNVTKKSHNTEKKSEMGTFYSRPLFYKKESLL